MSRLALTFGLAAMDTCWLYPWSLLLGLWVPSAAGRPLLSVPSLLALLLVSAWCAQFLGRRRMSRVRRASFAALALVTVTLAVRIDQFPTSGAIDWVSPLVGALALTVGDLSAPVLAFALGLLLWWRGIRLGSQAPSYVEVESGFRWGIGLLVTFGLIMALSTRPGMLATVEAQTTPFVVGFFFLSLVTLGLGRLESMRTRTRKLSVNTQWLSFLVVIAGVVVLLALLTAQVVSFDVLIVVTRPFFDVLGVILTLALYALVIPFAYVIQWLIYLILSMVQIDPNRPPPQPLEPAEVENLLQRFFAEHLSPELILGLKAACAVLLLGIGLFIVAQALSRWRPTSSDAEATNEERESLGGATRLSQHILAWLRRLFGSQRSVSLTTTASVSPPGPESPARLLSVRELYLQVLRLGAANGAARAAATTPLEHLPSLRRVLEPETTLVDLTNVYMEVRYGELDPPPNELGSLRDELEDLRPKAAID